MNTQNVASTKFDFEADQGQFSTDDAPKAKPASTPLPIREQPSTNTGVGGNRKVVPKSFSLTDYGNAERMVHKHLSSMRFVAQENTWYTWNDKRWIQEGSGEVQRFAKSTIRSIYRDIETLAGLAAEELDKTVTEKYEAKITALQKHLHASESKRAIEAMIDMSKSELGVTIEPDMLDGDAMKFNVLNGTLDLRSGTLAPHQSGDMMTKMAHVEFKGLDTLCPKWDKALNEIMCGDAEMVSYLQRCIGYSLTGLTREQCLFVMYGHGSNGKSLFLDIIRTIQGDYAQNAEFQTFLEKKGEGPRPDVARMKGVRFMSASEGPEGKHMDEPMIKSITGDARITARFLFGQFFEFTPTHKIFLATNHLPVIKGADNGIWRRLRLIPFEATFVKGPDGNMNENLMEELQAEMPGILAWAVRGCLEWQAKGLGIPARVKAATESYRADMDLIQNFLGGACTIEKSASAKSSKLYDVYKDWCDANGDAKFSQKRFSQKLMDKGFKKEDRRDGAYWIGLTAAKPTVSGQDDQPKSVNDISFEV